ncbi:sigma-70 family RNA polymerase sigma factor, partial [Adlercreutzia rubneri]
GSGGGKSLRLSATRGMSIGDARNHHRTSAQEADRERWRYLQKLDARNSLLSLDGFTDSEGNPLDFIADEAADIAETVVNAVMVDRLKAALPLLSDSEQELIQAIFFDGLSEREVGARLGITQSVVNKRKARILRKLRKIIEN